MTETSPVTIHVDHNGHGGWAVELSEPETTQTCRTLQEAQRVALHSAARHQPCELVIRDAYHRVLRREILGADGRERSR